MKGISQYTKQMYASGISDSAWKISTAEKNEPITYDSVRRLMDDDEMKAEADAKEYVVELDAYKADKERFNQELEAYRKAIEEGRDYVPDFDDDIGHNGSEKDIPDIPIYREVLDTGQQRDGQSDDDDIPDPNSDEFWVDEDYEGDEPADEGYSHVPSKNDYDFVNGAFHDALHRNIHRWYADDVEWFLSEVCA